MSPALPSHRGQLWLSGLMGSPSQGLPWLYEDARMLEGLLEALCVLPGGLPGPLLIASDPAGVK